MAALPPHVELAHYCTAWIWPDQSLEWMKSLLLFFDGVALALPKNHCEAVIDADPILAQPLYAAGLLRNFEPKTWMTKYIAAEIRRAADTVRLRHGEAQAHPKGFLPAESGITVSHFLATSEVSAKLINRMLESGTIIRRRPDLGADMVDVTRQTFEIILTVVGLAVRAMTTDYDIHLVTDYHGNRSTLIEALYGLAEATPENSRTRSGHYLRPVRRAAWETRIKMAPAIGAVLSADIENVGIDFTGIPLDEVLDYRNQHGDRYRAYARALRNFATDLISSSSRDQENMLRTRAEEIADYAAALRKTRRAFVRPVAASALSIAGAAWTIYQGDPLGAIFAALSGLAGFAKPSQPSSAFSYLFDARNVSRLQ